MSPIITPSPGNKSWQRFHLMWAAVNARDRGPLLRFSRLTETLLAVEEMQAPTSQIGEREWEYLHLVQRLPFHFEEARRRRF